jgi:hypothetical protein
MVILVCDEVEGHYGPAKGIAHAQLAACATLLRVPANFAGNNSSMCFCFLERSEVHADVVRYHTVVLTKVEEISHGATFIFLRAANRRLICG